MLNHIPKYVCFSFVPFVMASLVTVVLYCIGVIPTYYLIYTLIGWILIPGLGLAVGYHRMFSHQNYQNIPLWKENIILFLGTLSGQGSSITYSALHRGYHHPYSDTEKDIHSPIHGKYNSFIGWATKLTESNPVIKLKFAGRLLSKSNHVWFHKHHLKIMYIVPLTVALFDWKLSLALLCLPAGIAMLQDNTVNVFCHIKTFMGYRNFETKDNSENNFILGYLGWGQGWHNNHHHDPKMFSFRVTWYEFDPCVIFIPLLK